MALFNPEKGTWVLCIFIAFFGVIVAVNSVFITTALKTHSGVVTDQPYEKGLAYDAMLDKAKSQPSLKQQASYNGGILQWAINDEKGNPLEGHVTARLIRPIKDGKDFEISLKPVQPGLYQAKIELPVKGKWEAVLVAKWQEQHYQTRYPFIEN